MLSHHLLLSRALSLSLFFFFFFLFFFSGSDIIMHTSD